MKKILLINFLILLLLAAKAQQYHYIPFPDSGAVWSEIYRTAGEIPIYERFAVNGEDTLMNNKTYTKLYLFYDSIFDKTSASCIGGIREDSLKRVFYYGKEIHEFKPSFSNPKFNNGEVLLYDFGLEVGDTLRFFNTVFPDQLALVSAIDTVLIGNTLRKNF